MSRPIPSETTFGGLLLPPALQVCLLGLLVAVVIAAALNRAGWSRFFWRPPLAFLAMWLLFSAVIGLFFIAP